MIETHAQLYKRTRNHTNARAIIENGQLYKRTSNYTNTRNHTAAHAIIQPRAQS